MSFLNFTESPNPGKKTKVWDVFPKLGGPMLGRVGYYPQWRKYVFSPVGQTLFDSGCMREIADFAEAHREDRQ